MVLKSCMHDQEQTSFYIAFSLVDHQSPCSLFGDFFLIILDKFLFTTSLPSTPPNPNWTLSLLKEKRTGHLMYRTIMVLWKARALTPEQKVQIVEDESEANSIQIAEEEAIAKNLLPVEEIEAKSLQVVDEESEAKSLLTEESGSSLGAEDINMFMVYSSVLSLPVSIFSVHRILLSCESGCGFMLLSSSSNFLPLGMLSSSVFVSVLRGWT